MIQCFGLGLICFISSSKVHGQIGFNWIDSSATTDNDIYRSFQYSQSYSEWSEGDFGVWVEPVNDSIVTFQVEDSGFEGFFATLIADSAHVRQICFIQADVDRNAVVVDGYLLSNGEFALTFRNPNGGFFEYAVSEGSEYEAGVLQAMGSFQSSFENSASPCQDIILEGFGSALASMMVPILGEVAVLSCFVTMGVRIILEDDCY